MDQERDKVSSKTIRVVIKGSGRLEDILRKDGLSFELLKALSYQSNLGMRLKKNLHYFDRQELLNELECINEWYDMCNQLQGIAIDYRIKSIQSAIQKYERYFPDHQAAKVFNDLLGFRALCDNYESVLQMAGHASIRVADMSKGKSNDDGYRGVHVYFQLSNYHYPIEIQYNTYYDRQLNNWLHKYVYKRKYGNHIGYYLRQEYECGNVRNENEFKEALKYVLSDSKEV